MKIKKLNMIDQMKQQTVKSKNSLDFGEDMFGGGFGFLNSGCGGF